MHCGGHEHEWETTLRCMPVATHTATPNPPTFSRLQRKHWKEHNYKENLRP